MARLDAIAEVIRSTCGRASLPICSTWRCAIPNTAAGPKPYACSLVRWRRSRAPAERGRRRLGSDWRVFPQGETYPRRKVQIPLEFQIQTRNLPIDSRGYGEKPYQRDGFFLPTGRIHSYQTDGFLLPNGRSVRVAGLDRARMDLGQCLLPNGRIAPCICPNGPFYRRCGPL
jgi:hypothetical protein